MVADPVCRRSAHVEAGPGGAAGPAGVPRDRGRTIPGEAISRCLPRGRLAAGGDAVVLARGGLLLGQRRPASVAADRLGIYSGGPRGQRDTVQSAWTVGGRLGAAPGVDVLARSHRASTRLVAGSLWDMATALQGRLPNRSRPLVADQTAQTRRARGG